MICFATIYDALVHVILMLLPATADVLIVHIRLCATVAPATAHVLLVKFAVVLLLLLVLRYFENFHMLLLLLVPVFHACTTCLWLLLLPCFDLGYCYLSVVWFCCVCR